MRLMLIGMLASNSLSAFSASNVTATQGNIRLVRDPSPRQAATPQPQSAMPKPGSAPPVGSNLPRGSLLNLSV